MVKYISKGEWFDKGTAAKLLVDIGPSIDGKERLGLFEGIKDGKPDEEECWFSEFDMVEE